MPRYLIVLVFMGVLLSTSAQSDSLPASVKSRKIIVGGLSAAAVGGSLIYLQKAWYSDYNTGQFHFFNDNGEWQQMDKAGHVYSCYQLSRLMMETFEWAGYPKKTERWVGGTMGLAYMTAIEVMDGYSEGWGFSWGDEVANIGGTALAITQELLWDEQRLHLKFSYLPSGIAEFNPELLGETAGTRVLKDYNAQAYWVSFGAPLFNVGKDKFPQWLMVSLGYSAYGMTGGHENAAPPKDAQGNLVTFTRERIFLLSLDVDFTKIKTRSRFLRGLFSAVNVLKVPFPTIGFSQSGVKGHLFR